MKRFRGFLVTLKNEIILSLYHCQPDQVACLPQCVTEDPRAHFTYQYRENAEWPAVYLFIRDEKTGQIADGIDHVQNRDALTARVEGYLIDRLNRIASNKS